MTQTYIQQVNMSGQPRSTKRSSRYHGSVSIGSKRAPSIYEPASDIQGKRGPELNLSAFDRWRESVPVGTGPELNEYDAESGQALPRGYLSSRHPGSIADGHRDSNIYHRLMARARRNMRHRRWIPKAIIIGVVSLVVLCVALLIVEVVLARRRKSEK